MCSIPNQNTKLPKISQVKKKKKVYQLNNENKYIGNKQ